MAPRRAVGCRRRRMFISGVAVALLGSVVSAVTVASAAAADPIADAKAQAAVLAQTIDAQGRQIEVFAEQYNGARLHADQVAQQLATAEQRLLTATDQAARARAELGRQAVEAYTHGGYVSTPRPAQQNGGLDLVVQQDYFRLATKNEVGALDQMRLAEQNLTEQRAGLQGTQQQARDAIAALAGRQAAVVQAEGASRSTLAKVQGQLTQLVAEQQAALEAARVAQEKAALAAQLAKQQAQAQAAAAAAAAAQARLAAAPSPSNTRTGSGLLAPAPGPRQAPVAAPPIPAGSSRGLVALAFARAQLGKPYEWGASGPGTYDCSGLTMRAWQAAGVDLPHFAAAQYAGIAHVPLTALQPGDLVFFGSDLHHVGIYTGGGMMIDAPYTGTVVRYDSIYSGDLIGAGRPG